jgi:hypothetical protein
MVASRRALRRAAGVRAAGCRQLHPEVRVSADGGRTGERAGPARRRESRRLKILAFDPRPWVSGSCAALEQDPDFDVVARVRASRGLRRTGAAR